ncbi:hypothetical protein BJX68DRAFT_266608 [Aspergillus pseudodeflectus]|uniref:Xylanolytic transcriptional activator regulatory domain-containing protein n=1 Tax=Aspergillus pseudodeflectus TaxID=176178 RepID=A0ABR4KDQ2_9EURO
MFSLRAYPPTPLLEAAIYGMACSVNSAIVWWRDFDYIRAYIRKQLIGLFSVRTETTPQLQTVQALLIICFRAELVSTDYSDLVGLPAIATFACKLAQDLTLDIFPQPGVDGATEDEPLRRSIWKGCLFLDVYMAACFGHPPSIGPDKWVPLQLYTAEPVDASNWALAAFDDLILLSRDLHQILFTDYGVQQFSIGELWRGAVTTLQALNESEQRMSARIQAYDLDTRHALEMYGRDNRLLLARGIKLNMAHLPVELSDIPDLKSLLDEQTELVIHEALLTLSALSRGFLQSPYPRMGFPLYFIVRALFLAVEYANTLNHSASRPSSLRQRLSSAIDLAKHFTDVLLEPNKWGTEWCQGNTMRGVLSHLSSELSVTQWPPDLPSNHYDTADFEPWDSYFDAELISGFFAPANWDTLIEQYGFDSWLLSAYPGS